MNNKTTKKRQPPKNGKKFTKDYQPSPEAKSAGWKELRQQRHLTQTVIRKLLGETGEPTSTFKAYVDSLFKNAKKGNPKAIETINRCLEDDIIKVAQTDIDGNNVAPVTKVEIVPPTKIDGD